MLWSVTNTLYDILYSLLSKKAVKTASSSKIKEVSLINCRLLSTGLDQCEKYFPCLGIASIELDLNKITSGNGVISTDLDRYFYGSEVNVRAVPEQHWEFSHWDGDVEIPEPNNPEITIQLLKDSQLLANFNKIPYSLTVVSSPIDFGDSQTKNNIYTYFHQKKLS